MSTFLENSTQTAQDLLKHFTDQTGISDIQGDVKRRYLWSDALAVKCLIAVDQIEEEQSKKNEVVKLITEVHDKLGRFRDDDTRTGWISGYDEASGKTHPTAGGLRIGKNLPERGIGDAFDSRLEWDRDGQYFHYLTKWFHALMQAGKNYEYDPYIQWAADLISTVNNFMEVDNQSGQTRMFWKMSTDLQRPLISSMGAHDPLEGLLCCLKAKNESKDQRADLDQSISSLTSLCEEMEWKTTDPLGIGGLLQYVPIARQLEKDNITIPDSVCSKRLISDIEASLTQFREDFEWTKTATHRLAFRECGLSLGIRVLKGTAHDSHEEKLARNFTEVADQIEAFWLDPRNQEIKSWTSHLDINEVSLAASLLAKNQPNAFI